MNVKKTLLFPVLFCSALVLSCHSGKTTAHKAPPERREQLVHPGDAPITPGAYQAMLGKGLDVTWAESRKGIDHFNLQMVRDFRETGLQHIRIRVKNDPDEKCWPTSNVLSGNVWPRI